MTRISKIQIWFIDASEMVADNLTNSTDIMDHMMLVYGVCRLIGSNFNFNIYCGVLNINKNSNILHTCTYHRFILFENLEFFCEKIVHFKNLGKSLLTQGYSILYIVGITKES